LDFEQKIDKDIEPDTDYAAVFAGGCQYYAAAFGSDGYGIVDEPGALDQATGGS